MSTSNGWFVNTKRNDSSNGGRLFGHKEDKQ